MAIKAALVAVFVFVVAVTMMTPQVEGLTCGVVSSKLGPCLPYLKGTAGTPTKGCCDGVKALNGLASTTADKKTACSCIKSTAAGIKGINYGNAASLPGKCGVNIPYKISPSTDCTKIH